MSTSPAPGRRDHLSEATFHDLCDALTIIRGHTQLLMRRTQGAEPLDFDMVRMRLSAIDAMVTRMTQTILHMEPDIDVSASTPSADSAVPDASRSTNAHR